MKSAKAKGAKNERRSIALLEGAGYRCTRSGGSLGVWDVIGIGHLGIVLCQVKTRDWPGTEEMVALRAFPCPSNCTKLLHRWRDGQPVPDIRTI